MLIFLASPLFNEAEKAFNRKVADMLREAGFEVWMAQESPFISKGNEKEKRSIYKEDLSALSRSDVIVAILDGTEVDSGVAFEMGYATFLGKKIVGLKTDYRMFAKAEEVNLMLEMALMKLCRNVDGVIGVLKSLLLPDGLQGAHC